MTTAPWHLDAVQIDGYRTATLAPSAQSSAEAHLETCPVCRAAVAGATDGCLAGRIERTWAETAARIDAPRPRWLERIATTLGVPDHLARLIGASAGFRTAWFASLAVAVVAGLAVAGGGMGPVPFLLLSPLVPVAGVAAAFGGLGHAADTRSLEVATPYGEVRLVLVRTAAVTATSIVVLGLTTLALPSTGPDAAAWLLPALALTATTLALATRLAPERAAATVAVGWLALIAVLAAELPRSRRPTAAELGALTVPIQLGAAALLLASTVVFLRRRDRLDLPLR
ncbi:MAG: hypothetical protein JNK12_08235 [Acidimicrobiales bacterium]|nr:hypothetical protein [Acidimicrobiales bacterium]